MNLIQLALAAEELTRQQPVIQLTSAQCIRAKNIHAACELCVDLCPTGAIQLLDDAPVLAVDQCIKCGACLHSCPVGAFERTDGLYKLLRCAENLLDRNTLDIACAHHPAPAKADRRVTAVLQTGGCLSELGPSAYLGLKAIGVERIRVRLDACDDCPLRVLGPTIACSIANAQQIMAAFGLNEPVEVIMSDDKSWHWQKRPLYSSQNPPVSRRKLFTMFAPGTASLARTITTTPENSSDTGTYTPRERQRVLNSLRILAETHMVPAPTAALTSEGFTNFSVQETCTACGLCERVCPTGALHVNKNDTNFSVTFAPHLCTDCGLCHSYCEVEALQPVGSPLANDVLNGAVLQLHEGCLQQCRRCQTQFSGQPDEDLCPVCRYRRANPIGSQMPENLLARLPEETRQRLMQHQTRTASTN